MVPRHLRTIARQQNAESTGYMILGDNSRIPVLSMTGEYLEHLRKTNKAQFEASKKHLFDGQPTRSQEYKHNCVDAIGQQDVEGKWSTARWEQTPYSVKYLDLEGADWNISEEIKSGAIITNSHIIVLILKNRTMSTTMADALIGKPFSSVIDLPEPFIWTANLLIDKITVSTDEELTFIYLDIPERTQPSIVRTFPDPDMEEAADALIAQVQKLIRKMMKGTGFNITTLAAEAKVSESALKQAMTKGGDGPDLRMLAQLCFAMGYEPTIELKEEVRRSNRR